MRTCRYKRILMMGVLSGIVLVLSACGSGMIRGVSQTKGHMENKKGASGRDNYDIQSDEEIWEKGYDLPIDQAEEKEAREECKKTLVYIGEMYENIDSKSTKAEKSDPDHADVFSQTILEKISNTLGQKGIPVTIADSPLGGTQNYEKMDRFFERASKGEECEEVLYEIDPDGTVSRKKYSFDGKDMYVLDCIGLWSKEETGISMISYTRLMEWEYTDRGWFRYELCVPEPPVLTEVMEGSVLIRIIPMKEEFRVLTEKWLLPIGYRGNNLLRSEWDADHMEQLDYNGLFEYLYFLKYQHRLDSEQYMNGIPREEFEGLLTEYLPVTVEELRRYAVYDEETGRYAWAGVGCTNYTSSIFAVSIPEITAITENADGTATWTVDIVCEILGQESVIGHQITVRMGGEGEIRYLKNHILGDGMARIPEYTYRCRGD